MPIRYYKLFDLINRRGMKTDLIELAGISSLTLAKFTNCKMAMTEVIEKL
ncbi:XRE family transcriptional regulator [Paenibacillus sp. 1011MAR3C5]|nr:XRE family transcriptional regulator [Paenibacillus sp. 1011MAR3C5]